MSCVRDVSQVNNRRARVQVRPGLEVVVQAVCLVAAERPVPVVAEAKQRRMGGKEAGDDQAAATSGSRGCGNRRAVRSRHDSRAMPGGTPLGCVPTAGGYGSAAGLPTHGQEKGRGGAACASENAQIRHKTLR